MTYKQLNYCINVIIGHSDCRKIKKNFKQLEFCHFLVFFLRLLLPGVKFRKKLIPINMHLLIKLYLILLKVTTIPSYKMLLPPLTQMCVTV